MDTPFKFDIALEAFEKADAGEGKERRIGGVVSTDHLDRQEEVLIQQGLDMSPFLKAGWFNDNHSTETDSIVGILTPFTTGRWSRAEDASPRQSLGVRLDRAMYCVSTPGQASVREVGRDA